MKEGRQPHVIDRKNQILEAASRLFERRGLHRVRMEDIASEAGVGKGTVYLYFASKEELITGVIRMRMDSLVESVSSIARETTPVRERIREILECFIAFADRYEGLAHLVSETPHIIGKEARKLFLDARKRVVVLLSRVIRQGIERGEIRDTDPLLISLLVFETAKSFAAERGFSRMVDDELSKAITHLKPAELASRLTELLSRGIAM